MASTPTNVPSPSSRAYAGPSGRVTRPPGLPNSPKHFIPQAQHSQLQGGSSSSHLLHPSLLAQQHERMVAQEKAQQIAASLHSSQYQQQHSLRYAPQDVGMYRPEAVVGYGSPQSPVSRPLLPQLVLPKSPDVGPLITPSSPQALRATLSPSKRYVGLNGGMRDGRWGGGGGGAGAVNEVNDWLMPEGQPPPHRRQLTPFHPVAANPSQPPIDPSSLYEIREEGEGGGGASASTIWTAELHSQSLMRTNASSASSPFLASQSVLALPLSIDTPWSTPSSPSGASLLRLPLSSSTPSTVGFLVDDVTADDEDLMDLQALESWDAENDRRAHYQAVDAKDSSATATAFSRLTEVEASGDESEEEEKDGEGDGLVKCRKDSMNNGLAEALGRARALHSITLARPQVKVGGEGGGSHPPLHAARGGVEEMRMKMS